MDRNKKENANQRGTRIKDGNRYENENQNKNQNKNQNQDQNKNENRKERDLQQLAYIGIPVVLLVILLRFILFYLKSDGLSGISLLFPLLIMGIVAFALLMSGFFAAWVFQDCKKRKDDGVLWAVIVVAATPFIGLLVYLLRRQEIQKSCVECGHSVSLKANYCEQCGSKMEDRKEMTDMEIRRTHHMSYIITGVISMVLMLACLTGFIVSAASGNGINSDITSNKRVWNKGVIRMNYESCLDGVWKMDFRSASDGFVAEEKLIIQNAESNCLYADISCGTVPDGAGLTLYLVQEDRVKSFDVTGLSEALTYPLTGFENGELYVRLVIEGVEDTVSEIRIE